MSDVKCPYCDKLQYIDHDDGYGYDDGGIFEQECVYCEKEFKFITSVILTYEVHCQDKDHVMEPWGPKWPRMYSCANCDHSELRGIEDE